MYMNYKPPRGSFKSWGFEIPFMCDNNSFIWIRNVIGVSVSFAVFEVISREIMGQWSIIGQPLEFDIQRKWDINGQLTIITN